MTQTSSWIRHIRTWHIGGVLLFIAVSGLSVYAFWPSIADTPEDETARPDAERTFSRARVDVLVLKPSDFVIRAEATGHLTPWREAEISSEATGIVVARPHEEGTFVRAGELLLSLEDREQAIAVRQAETEVLQAQVDYAGRLAAGGNISNDTSLVALARVDLERATNGYNSDIITESELRVIRRKFEAAVLRSGVRRDEVEAVVTGLTQAEQRLDRARLLASRMQVKAPIRGRIAELKTEVGQRVTIGQVVMSLLDDSRMKVDVNVLESDLLGLATGATARVRIPALADSVIEGRIFSINPMVDPATGTGRVTVSINNPLGELISGLFAYIELEADRISERLIVPAEAVLVRQGRDLVFVVEDGRAQWTYVTVGRRSGDHVEIIEHLAAGDSVAVAGHHALSHDARVQVGSVVEASN